jgi:hypothetical protein
MAMHDAPGTASSMYNGFTENDDTERKSRERCSIHES